MDGPPLHLEYIEPLHRFDNASELVRTRKNPIPFRRSVLLEELLRRAHAAVGPRGLVEAAVPAGGRVPVVAAVGPGQRVDERVVEEVAGPGHDHVVVGGQQERDHHRGQAGALEQRADALHGQHRSLKPP